MGRGAETDDRIKALVADVNMLTGEFKLVAMAALLTAIVQRQSVMRDEMRQMHVQMMRGTTERSMPAPAADLEPGGMCSPTL